MSEEPRIVEVKGLAEALSDKDLLVDMQIKMAEMCKDFLNMAACFQEVSATLNEFMKSTDTRMRHIETNCNREERWENAAADRAAIRLELRELDIRMTAIERAKCPKTVVFEELRTRLDAVEDVHTKEAGWKAGVAPYIQFIVAGALVIQSIVISYAFMMIGVH